MKNVCNELVERFWDNPNINVRHKEAIRCAIICVEEILKTSPIVPNDATPVGVTPKEYWVSVLDELEQSLTEYEKL